MDIEKFFDKRAIIEASFFYPLSLLRINKDKIIVNNKLLSSLGKGKWVILFSALENKSVTIKTFSFGLLGFLLDKLISSKEVSFNFSSNFLASPKKIKTEIANLDKFMNISIEKNGIKVSGKLDKINFINMLEKITRYPQNFVVLNVQSGFQKFSVEYEEITLKMKTNISEEYLLETFNELFKVNNKSAPCYYLIYADIKDIKGGGWKTAKRHSEIVKEWGSFEDKKIKRYKF